LESLATKAGYHDVSAVSLLRQGAPLVGKLDNSGYYFTSLVIPTVSVVFSCSQAMVQRWKNRAMLPLR